MVYTVHVHVQTTFITELLYHVHSVTVVVVVIVVVFVVVVSGAVLLFHKCSVSGVYYVNHNYSSSPRPHSYLSCLTS